MFINLFLLIPFILKAGKKQIQNCRPKRLPNTSRYIFFS